MIIWRRKSERWGTSLSGEGNPNKWCVVALKMLIVKQEDIRAISQCCPTLLRAAVAHEKSLRVENEAGWGKIESFHLCMVLSQVLSLSAIRSKNKKNKIP